METAPIDDDGVIPGRRLTRDDAGGNERTFGSQGVAERLAEFVVLPHQFVCLDDLQLQFITLALEVSELRP